MKHEHKTVAEVLRCARRLIARKDGWTQGVYARGKTGLSVYEHGRAAVSFCAIGAIRKCAGDYDQGKAAKAALSHSLHGRSVVNFNDADDSRKSDVLALFTHAIKCAEEAKEYA